METPGGTAPYRVVLFYADTGGGHRAVAEAIAEAFESLGDAAVETVLVNGTKYLPWPFDQSESTYPVVIAKARFLHAAFFHLLDGRRRAAALNRWLQWSGARRLRRLLHEHPADIVVSCQPLFAGALSEAIRSRCPHPPALVHVVTDLVTGHASTFVNDADLLIVPSAEAQARALRHGVDPTKMLLLGMPVRSGLQGGAAERSRARHELRLDPNRPIVLVAGGGEGMGRMRDVVSAIAQSGLEIQLVAVCGRNRELHSELAATPSGLEMTVFGFVERWTDLLIASDILVTKAGPQTISEGLAAGVPMVLYDAVPGQETGNIDYVVKCGAGAWCPSPRQVVARLRTWLEDPALRRQAAEAARRCSMPSAAPDCARAILALAAQRRPASCNSLGVESRY